MHGELSKKDTEVKNDREVEWKRWKREKDGEVEHGIVGQKRLGGSG